MKGKLPICPRSLAGKDYDTTSNAHTVLVDRYLLRDASGNLLEEPRDLFLRVARTVASARRTWGATSADVASAVQTYFELMTSGRFLPNSPTLMNAGCRTGMLSACVVLPLEDSLSDIMDTARDIAVVQKAGGGTGLDLSRLRPRGSRISSTGGEAGGPISFLRMLSGVTAAIQSGSHGRGANMGVLRVDHPDILEFVRLKADPHEVSNYNLSVGMTDVFMRRLKRLPDAPHEVVDPRTGTRADAPFSVGELWREIAYHSWRSGEPGLVFLDEINRHNTTPQSGAVRATNPCGEQPLLDNESCNLGSLNLSSFYDETAACLDMDALVTSVETAVAFLDDVIDANQFPIESIARTCRAHRRIGLGVMGFADLLFLQGIPYDSQEALDLAQSLASRIRSSAWDASSHLASERGCFPNWESSTWATERKRPMRNAAVTTVAPTGTISILAGCTGGIEPAFSLAFVRRVLGGQKLIELNPVFFTALRQHGTPRRVMDAIRRHALERGTIQDCNPVPVELKAVFRTAHDISPRWHVRMQAAWQAHTDAAVSKTVNLPAQATLEDVSAAFHLAHRLRCKGITVYRNGCRNDQPMSLGASASACPRC